jgi:hypothetical protein
LVYRASSFGHQLRPQEQGRGAAFQPPMHMAWGCEPGVLWLGAARRERWGPVPRSNEATSRLACRPKLGGGAPAGWAPSPACWPAARRNGRAWQLPPAINTGNMLDRVYQAGYHPLPLALIPRCHHLSTRRGPRDEMKICTSQTSSAYSHPFRPLGEPQLLRVVRKTLY